MESVYSNELRCAPNKKALKNYLYSPHGLSTGSSSVASNAQPWMTYPKKESKSITGKALQMARMIQCIKLNKEAEGLDFAPLPGELGKKIWNQVSKEAWAGWLKQQTMLINENRLNMADPRARQYLLKQVEKYFFEGGADTAQGYVPPAE